MASEALSYLRAMIREDLEAAGRHEEAMADKTWEEAGGLEAGAAFQIAATRRFSGKPLSEIVKWVAETRAELGDNADEIEPELAEALLRAAVRGEHDKLEGIDQARAVQVQLIMTAKLGMEADLSDTALDAYMAEAENLAASWESGK